MLSPVAAFRKASIRKIVSGDKRIKNIYHIKNIYYGDYTDSYSYKKTKVTFSEERPFFRKASRGTKSDFSLQRARENVYRIAQANIRRHGDYKPVFVTLTTKDQISEYRQSNRKIKQLARRMKEYLGYKVKYLLVPELHKSGAIHYHGIFFNIPFIPVQDFRFRIWKYGYVDLKVSTRIRDTAAYLAKYLTKSYKENIPLNQKTYFTSRGLFYPLTAFDSLTPRGRVLREVKLKEVTIKKIKCKK